MDVSGFYRTLRGKAFSREISSKCNLSVRVLRYLVWVLCASAAILIASSSNAYAYVDPGYGVLLWQLLIAGFFGALFYARNIVSKIKSWFKTTKVTREE